MISYIKNLMAYLFEVTLVYYLLPLMLVDTGLSMIALLVIVPLLLMVISFSYGFESKKLDLIYVLGVGLLFIPIMLTYMNTSAFLYCVIYAVISLIANTVGSIVSKNKPSKNKK